MTLSVRTSTAALLTFALAISQATAQQDSPADPPPPYFEIVPEYPRMIPAGTPFVLRLRVHNHSEIPLSFHGGQHTLSLSGGHADSFDFQRCYEGCLLKGTDPTPPGEEVLMEAGTLYYRNQDLFSGGVSINDIRVNATAPSDDGSIASYSVPAATAVTIQIQHSSETPEENSREDGAPVRSALELRDLAETGDQRLLHDPNTGNDWLRLTQTTGLTETSLAEKTAPGGEYAGFAVAYAAQVEELILNHLHAGGIEMQAYELAAPFAPQQTRDSLALFMDSIGGTGEAMSVPRVAGAVRDRAPLHPTGDVFHTLVALHGSSDDGYWRPARPGPLREYASGDQIESSSSIGVWLVRTPQAMPQRPDDRASYLSGNLMIPDVIVDGTHYRVHLRLENEVSSRLRLTGLNPRTASGHAVPFDAEQGTLTLENAVWLTIGEEPQRFDLQLKYLSDSDPAVFHVTQLQEADPEGD